MQRVNKRAEMTILIRDKMLKRKNETKDQERHIIMIKKATH